MIELTETSVVGLEHALRGMRNPKNSWRLSDSTTCDVNNIEKVCNNQCEFREQCFRVAPDDVVNIGERDLRLAKQLAHGGPVHAKYRRMIVVYVDIVAPLYWWKEFDTYKVGTVSNSCSTMHKITERPFTLQDFSVERTSHDALMQMTDIIDFLEGTRQCFNEEQDKDLKQQYWEDIIQMLPSSYNQKRTIMLNYEVLAGIYPMRKSHKLKEWRVFCEWIESLPYSELITEGVKKNEDCN